MKLWILFVSEYNEIMCNTANELSGQKRFWRKRWRAKEAQRKERQRAVMEGGGMWHLSFCHWYFLCNTYFVLVFHADLKPLLRVAYVKDCRPPDVMPPGAQHVSPHLCWPLFIDFLNSCHPLWPFSVSVHHQLSPPSFPSSNPFSALWLSRFFGITHCFLGHLSYPCFDTLPPFFSLLLLISSLSVSLSLSSPWSEPREHEDNCTDCQESQV